MIKFNKVTKAFGLKKALHEVDLQISPGEFVAIVGPSGAGKSTFVNLLIGAILPTDGEVLVDEVSIPSLTGERLQNYRRNVGVVFQDYKLLPKKTVHENVSFAAWASNDPDRLIRNIPAILESVGIGHRAGAFPHELSGGEAQRAALARALIHQPSLIIADEPTGNLDTENQKKIMQLLRQLNQQGKTIILTTHNVPLASGSGCRMIHLREGRVV